MEKAEISRVETDRQIAEIRRQTEEIKRQGEEDRVKFAREAAARAAEAAREMAEIRNGMAETRKLLDKLGIGVKDARAEIGGISKSNGMFAEEYFANSLEEKLTFAGIHFDGVGDRFGGSLKLPDGSFLKDQFDIVLINDEAVAVIEVKYRARVEDVDNLVDKKVKNFRILHPYYKDHRIYLGLGAMTFEQNVAYAAKERGVGILRQVGETAEDETAWEVRAY